MRINCQIFKYCIAITVLLLFTSIANCQVKITQDGLFDLHSLYRNVEDTLYRNRKDILCKDEYGNDIHYRQICDTAVVIAHSGTASKAYSMMIKVKIPEYITYCGKSYKVIGIEDFAFSPPLKGSYPNFSHESSKLSEIILPNTIYSIGECAFQHCQSLKCIIIPNSVSHIGNSAFMGCEGLEDVVMSNSVTIIQDWTFAGCKSLKHIVLPTNLKSIGNFAFLQSGLQIIDFPQSLESIGRLAFFKSSLQSIYFPLFVKFIDNAAFLTATNLKNVKGLHSGIKLGQDVFKLTQFDLQRYKNTFEYYANSVVLPQLVDWQRKREFETSEMYLRRVTKENQTNELERLTAKAIINYVENKRIVPVVDSYDADNELYRITTNCGEHYVGACYINVPLSEAPSFKDQFKKAKIDTKYVMSGDSLKIKEMTISIGEKRYTTSNRSSDYTYTSSLDIDLPMSNFALDNRNIERILPQTTPLDNFVDKNIPSNSMDNKFCFAVIIGNEDYQRVSQVPYASNDALIFAEYCRKTLGLPEKNVRVYENATFGTMIGAISDLKKIAKAFKGDINVIFYYAGHGIPNETTKESYLLPIDADGMNTEVCYPLTRLYRELGELEAKRVTVFMDACFSGAERGDGMVVAARGVAIKPKNNQPLGNTIVFSAATGQQAAYPYKEKGHGMFTYYLLKKLQDTKGDVTLGELGQYICDEAAKQAILTNGKEQTPIVLTPIGMSDEWKNWKLK